MYRCDSTGKELWNIDVDYSSSDHWHFGFERREGGYYLGGHTDSKTDPKGDMWLVRYDSARHMIWEKTYDRGFSEHAHAGIETRDGGCLLVGHTNLGNLEKYWIVRVDSNGVEKWRKMFSSNDTYDDSPYHVVETREGNFAIFGGSSSPTSGAGTIWLLVLDPSGNIVLDRHYGNPTYSSFAWAGRQTSDGGYVMAGYTTYNTVGDADLYLVKAAADGTLEWEKRYGGKGPEYGYDVIETNDGYIACGVTGSTDLGAGAEGDMLLVKFKKDVVLPLPSAITLVAPAANATLADTASVLRWRPGTPSVTRYELDIATDSSFTQKIVDSSLTDTSALRANLTNGGKYWWRVRAYNATGWGPYSEVRKFTVASYPATVALIYPAQNGVVDNTDVQMRWGRSAPGVTRYQLDVATDSQFSTATADSSLTDTTMLRTGFVFGSTYWWRVRAANSVGWGPYSEARTFTVQEGASVERGSESAAGLAIYPNIPNPFGATTTFRFHQGRRGEASMVLVDLAGRQVATICSGMFEAGDHAIPFDGSRIPSGIYICRLVAPGIGDVSRRVMVVH
jgi:hypothetical protein